MPLPNIRRPPPPGIGFAGHRPRLRAARITPQPHRAALAGNPLLLRHYMHHRMRRCRLQLRRIGPLQPQDMPRPVNHHHLQPQTQPQIRHPLLPRITHRSHHPLHPPGPEPAGNHNAADLPQQFLRPIPLHILRMHPPQLHIPGMAKPGMAQGFADGQVRVGIFHILPDDGDGQPFLGPVHHRHHIPPLVQPGAARQSARQPQRRHDNIPQPRRLQRQRHPVNILHRRQWYHRFAGNVAKGRYLFANLRRNRMVAAADDRIRLDPDRPQFLDAVLRRLGFQLLRRRQIRQQRQMDVKNVAPPHLVAHLPDGLQKRQPLDIAHRAAHLDHNHRRPRLLGQAQDPFLNVVSHVRHRLNRPAEEIPPALLGDQVLVNIPRRQVGAAGKLQIDEPLVMPQIQVGLPPVLGHEHLPVLVRRHRPRVHIQVRVQFQHRNAHPPAFQDAPHGGDTNPLAQRAYHAAGNEYELCSHTPAPQDYGNRLNRRHRQRKTRGSRQAAAQGEKGESRH